LEAVEKKLHQASDTIEKAKVRSKAIGRKLRDVQELPADDAMALLPRSLATDELESSNIDETQNEQTPFEPVPVG